MPPPLERTSTRLGAGALVLVAAVFTLAACRRIWGVDFWWQYATGRHVAEHGIPHEDVFSYTKAGAEWIELRWLYCWGLYGAEQLIGFAGLVVLKWLLLAGAFGLVVLSVRVRPRVELVAAVLLAAVLTAMQRFFVRPELVTFLFFGLYVWIIQRHRARGGRLLFLLPVAQVVWTNAHTVFILGPLLVGLHAVVCAGTFAAARRGGAATGTPGRELRTALLVLVLTVLACLANPYGLRGTLFPFTLFEEMSGSGFKDFIDEFKSPFAYGFTFDVVWFWLLLAGTCAASAAVNLRRLDPFLTVLVAAQLYLSAVAIRNLPLFALAAIPFCLDNLGRAGTWRDGHRRALGLALVVFATGGFYAWQLLTNGLYLATGDTNRTGLGLARHHYPQRAVEFLRANGMTGRTLQTFREASYCAAHGIPVFMDPRLEVYGEDHFLEFMRISGGPQANPIPWRAAVAKHRFEIALLDLHSPLVERILAEGEWTLRYFDEVAAVLAKPDAWPAVRPIASERDFARAVQRIRRHLPRAPEPGLAFGAPQPYLFVAGFLLKRGRHDLARSFLEDARRAYRETEAIRRGFRLIDGNGGGPR